jgi:integrase
MNTTSTDVKFWDVRRNKSSKTTSYEVRWVVAGRERSRSRRGKALAEAFLSDLRQAARKGEAFDVETGLPVSMLAAKPSMSWLAFALKFIDMKWPRAAAKTRDSLTDALATVTAALVDEEVRGRPDAHVLRRALRQFVLSPAARASERPSDVADALAWLERASLPLSELAKPRTVRLALDAISLRMDGGPAAATTIRRKRAVFFNALQYAVELEELPANPLTTLTWKPPKVAEVVDRRSVVNPRQARELLTAVTYVGRPANGRKMRAFFACMYFAGMRPAEVSGLRAQDCHLPDQGWGRLVLTDSRPQTNKRWTDSGESQDTRGLKHRAEQDTRPVPIPPDLVAILREYLEEFGAAEDGRLFRTRTGKVITNYADFWQAARVLALLPHQVTSPLAARPYDLRHAAVSLWLNAGVSAPEVAERAGHGVDVLLRVYAKCIDGDAAVANQRIQTALAA